jgi:hypothetical protein
LIPLAACEPWVDGNGQPAMETRAIEGFDAVDSKGDFEVRVEQGDSFQVAVNLDSNLLSLLQTRVVGSKLEITSDHHLNTHLAGPHVTVKMPDVAAAELSGSGRLTVLSIHEAHPVSVQLSGSGTVDFDGTAPLIRADVSGSGDINLAGTADEIRLGLSGSGYIDAVSLAAQAGSVNIAGSGSVRATINGPADVVLSGSGDVDLYGDVALQHMSKTGSGAIRVH